jgi:mevalonate kinase
MGSSAALAATLSYGISRMQKKSLDIDLINNLAYEIEKLKHINSSGSDVAISVNGGLLWYRKEADYFRLFKKIEAKQKLPHFFILNSGCPIETTGDMVTYVRKKYEANKHMVSEILDQIEEVTKSMLAYLVERKNVDFFGLINKNERLLEKLGVVSPSTKVLIRKIEKLGGVAKISGAGGLKGGSGNVLVFHKNQFVIKAFAKKEQITFIKVKIGGEGVKYE